MSLEKCPFCGKPFKRLKSHLPHCKMSPVLKTAQITNNTLKETLDTTSKHTRDKDKKNKVNSDTRLSYQKFQVNSKSNKVEKVSTDEEFLQNSSFTITSTSSKVPSVERAITDTLKPKIKWLAKQEQEKLKQVKLPTRGSIKVTGVSQHNSETNSKNQVKGTPILEKETNGQKKLTGTSLTSDLTSNSIDCPALEPVQRSHWTTRCQAEQSVPQYQASPKISEQIQTSPKPLTKECTLASGIKQQDVVVQTKTCVWDHIKHGLYKSRHGCLRVSIPQSSAQKVSLSKCVNTTECVIKLREGNEQNATMKTVQLPNFQTSGQRQGEDRLRSRLQNVSVMAYSPEMATGYGGTFFFSSRSETSNGNLLMKYQTSKPSAQSQGLITELRLGDVRLNELASWLGARTPKSPREALTTFNRGWQWYYRKYIDVQKGGFGGIAMLIGSYCVLSYIWNYPNIKKHRWRKYH